VKRPDGRAWPNVYRHDSLANPWPVSGAALVATSTPYWSKRTYGTGGGIPEFGHGPVEAFINDQVQLARRALEATRPGAWYALNLGDTMANTGGSGGDGKKRGQKIVRPDNRDHNFDGPQMVGIPWRVALAIRERTGWQLRGHIVWAKGRAVMTENSLYHSLRNRRPGQAHEDIFLFRRDDGPAAWNVNQANFAAGWAASVWNIPAKVVRPPWANTSDSTAPWPDEIVRRLTLMLTDPGDLVVDPCAGYGTTARVAMECGRRGVALDLYSHTTDQYLVDEAVSA
jgi:DNA methylase